MIQEHFCNYENSLALKELGFDVKQCLGGWLGIGYCGVKEDTFQLNPHIEYPENAPTCKAPLLSQAIQWILEQFNITIEIRQESFIPGWAYWLWDGSKFLGAEPGYETWNQCAQDGLSKAIQIIKDERTNIDTQDNREV